MQQKSRIYSFYVEIHLKTWEFSTPLFNRCVEKVRQIKQNQGFQIKFSVFSTCKYVEKWM